MKKFIHFQIPINEKGYPTITSDTMAKFILHCKKIMPKYYKIIATPFKMTVNGSVVEVDIKNVDDKLVQKFDEHIKEIIEKEGFVVSLIK